MPNDVTKQPLWIQSGDPETENLKPADDLQPGAIGAHITLQSPGPGGVPQSGSTDYFDKTYQKVEVDSALGAGPNPYNGCLSYWTDEATYRVTTDVTGRRGLYAGVLRTAVVPGYRCFIQQRGPGMVKFVDVPTAEPTAAGLIVIPSATAGKADCLAAGTAATYPSLGASRGVANLAREGIVNLGSYIP
ncbi:MAG: hypothetical protein KKE65_09715 [Actinobacteria bacterium]|nr:hypothetical protein [Actinomycetota bacterium]